MIPKPIYHNGVEVELAHLAPLVFGCPCSQIGRDICIRTIFRNHCYTEKFDSAKHLKQQICVYDSEERPRVFCAERHALSFGLPELVCALSDKKVRQTPEVRNYVYAAPMESDGKLYEVYFMLQRHRVDGADLRLTVESAYSVDAPSPVRGRPNTIRFAVLAFKILKNEPVKFAPR